MAFFESARDFLSVVDPPKEYLVNELIPPGVLVLMHGEPRTKKSLAALDIAISLATETPAFGLERFQVSKVCQVLYVGQEDPSCHVRAIILVHHDVKPERSAGPSHSCERYERFIAPEAD